MINLERQHGIYTISIVNPRLKNALSTQGMTRMLTALNECVSDKGCRCIVIEGSDGSFCSGRFLEEDAKYATLEELVAYDSLWADIIQLLITTDIPSVAAVEGYAVAGGFTLAMACDFVISTEGACFGALEMQGGFPAAINAAVLAHKASPRTSLRYLLSKDTFKASSLYREGLINEVAIDAAELAGLKRIFVEKLAALDPTATRLTKETYRVCGEASPEGAVTIGRQLNSLLMSTGRISAAARQLRARKPPTRLD
jgi:enoyl-CoA hydratase/carnithine racemase